MNETRKLIFWLAGQYTIDQHKTKKNKTFQICRKTSRQIPGNAPATFRTCFLNPGNFLEISRKQPKWRAALRPENEWHRVHGAPPWNYLSGLSATSVGPEDLCRRAKSICKHSGTGHHHWSFKRSMIAAAWRKDFGAQWHWSRVLITVHGP